MADDEVNPAASSHGPADGPWSSPFDDLLTTPPPATDAEPGASPTPRADPCIGTPDQDATLFPGQQEYQDTCAIRCQEFIIKQYTGLDIPEEQLMKEAAEHGWYAPSQGTPPEQVGNLLELHGIPVKRCHDATIFHLAEELGQGHKVIVGVNSGELWGSNSVIEEILDYFGLEQADHAVVVSGIDTTDRDHPQVIVSDPGTGEAVGRYPLEKFLDAWKDSDFFMVSTQEPAPSHLPEMAHFDYDAGHIPEVADMPWDEFTGYEDRPHAWEHIFEQQLHAEHEREQHQTSDASRAALPDPSHAGPLDPSHDTACDPSHVAVFEPSHGAATTDEMHAAAAFIDNGDGLHQTHLDDAVADPALEAEGRHLVAEADARMDEIDREAFAHELHSELDPATFTDPYDG